MFLSARPKTAVILRPEAEGPHPHRGILRFAQDDSGVFGRALSAPRCRVTAALLLAFAAEGACSSSSAPVTKPPPAPVATGATLMFDAKADLDSTAHFFDFPWPSDLRLSSAGTPNVEASRIL
jgi:hypothetical protein